MKRKTLTRYFQAGADCRFNNLLLGALVFVLIQITVACSVETEPSPTVTHRNTIENYPGITEQPTQSPEPTVFSSHEVSDFCGIDDNAMLLIRGAAERGAYLQDLGTGNWLELSPRDAYAIELIGWDEDACGVLLAELSESGYVFRVDPCTLEEVIIAEYDFSDISGVVLDVQMNSDQTLFAYQVGREPFGLAAYRMYYWYLQDIYSGEMALISEEQLDDEDDFLLDWQRPPNNLFRWSNQGQSFIYTDFDITGIQQVYLVENDLDIRRQITDFQDPSGWITSIGWNGRGDTIFLVYGTSVQDTFPIVIGIQDTIDIMEFHEYEGTISEAWLWDTLENETMLVIRGMDHTDTTSMSIMELSTGSVLTSFFEDESPYFGRNIRKFNTLSSVGNAVGFFFYLEFVSLDLSTGEYEVLARSFTDESDWMYIPASISVACSYE